MAFARIVMALCIVAMLMVLVSYRSVERDAGDTAPPDDGHDPLLDPSYEWVAAMGEAVVAGDVDAGYEAEQHLYVRYDDAALLARYLEAVWRPGWADEYVMMAGEVVINRIASAEFEGTTVREVLFAQDAPGVAAFDAVRVPWWDQIQISRSAAGVAMQLLLGESVLHDPQIVYIGQVAKPWGYARTLPDNDGGCTYLCRTGRPEVYG